MTAQKPFRIFSFLDGIIILLAALGAAAFIPFLQSNAPATVAVYRDKEKIAEYALTDMREFSVDGIHGKLVIDITPEGARVFAAHCPNQICVRTGFIRLPGSQIICVPNHIIVEIKKAGEKEPGVDAVVQ